MTALAKKYQEATFKGVAFKVDTSDTQGGRRVVSNEYPFRDVNFSRDLGKKAKQFSFEAYVIGPDYEAERDALIEACDSAGSGELIHPYFGTRIVVCTGYSIRESKKELGIAYFSFSFIEEGEQTTPTQGVDAISRAKTTLERMQEISSAAFEKVYAVADAPSFVTDSAEEKVGGFADFVDFNAQKINGLSQKLADYTYQIRNMKADIVNITQSPARVAQNFVKTLNAFLAVLPGGSLEMKLALKGITRYGQDFDTSNNSTPNRQAESQNSKALRDLSFQITTGLLASEAIDRTYKSFEDAEKDRNEVLDLIDQILGETGDDNVYEGFHRLRLEIISAVPGVEESLPRIVTVQNPAETPSLVMAYDLYEELSLEQDLIERNNIANPAFMPGLQDLQVLRFS